MEVELLTFRSHNPYPPLEYFYEEINNTETNHLEAGQSAGQTSETGTFWRTWTLCSHSEKKYYVYHTMKVKYLVLNLFCHLDSMVWFYVFI